MCPRANVNVIANASTKAVRPCTFMSFDNGASATVQPWKWILDQQFYQPAISIPGALEPGSTCCGFVYGAKHTTCDPRILFAGYCALVMKLIFFALTAFGRLIRWEIPRLCRGGSSSLTNPEVSHSPGFSCPQRTSDSDNLETP